MENAYPIKIGLRFIELENGTRGSGVTEVTIRNRYKEISKTLGIEEPE